ncbi:MAG: helix-turn-helix domain-containing protein [Lentihominibacter sp.]
MFTKEIILMCYIACIVLIVAGITCCMLVAKRKNSKTSRAHMFFLLSLLIMCMYDMGIYYWNYVIGNFSSMEVMRIGSCIIAVTMFMWVLVQEKIVRREALKLLNRTVKNYLIFYAVLWLILTFALNVQYFYTIKWLLLSTDIILIVAFLGVSVAHIIFAAVQNDRGSMYYLSVVTALLLWNYGSYFWGETSVYWGDSDFIREPLDLTIVFWLIISGAALVYVYNRYIVPAFFSKGVDTDETDVLKTSGSRWELSERIDEVCSLYGLTSRERELIELIYGGKSNREIAEILFLSENTVKTHIYNIFRKTGVKSRVGVICIINDEPCE